jgi:glycosyltransferase involved in cell wall biosynthesis
MPQPLLSLVIPVYHEAENISHLITAIEQALPSHSYEIIFVDDGSTDRTVAEIQAQSLGKNHIRLLVFSRNFGQTSAMAAGIEAARGTYIATLDGDLQNDPADIPAMLALLEKEQVDMVAGYRANRKDGMLLRKIPSRIANRLIRSLSHVEVRDYGCTLKLFKTSIAKDLDLYGELHRFIPILASLKGAKIAEMPVQHHARKFGTSKYGLSRTLKVASDLMLMAFFLRYRQKPMHLFGGLGLVSFTFGGFIECYLLICKLLGESIGGRPLFFVGIVLIIAGIQLITTGFLAELLMRTYFSAKNQSPYLIKNTYEGGIAK